MKKHISYAFLIAVVFFVFINNVYASRSDGIAYYIFNRIGFYSVPFIIGAIVFLIWYLSNKKKINK